MRAFHIVAVAFPESRSLGEGSRPPLAKDLDSKGYPTRSIEPGNRPDGGWRVQDHLNPFVVSITHQHSAFAIHCQSERRTQPFVHFSDNFPCVSGIQKHFVPVPIGNEHLYSHPHSTTSQQQTCEPVCSRAGKESGSKRESESEKVTASNSRESGRKPRE